MVSSFSLAPIIFLTHDSGCGAVPGVVQDALASRMQQGAATTPAMGQNGHRSKLNHQDMDHFLVLVSIYQGSIIGYFLSFF